jgi:hypothetical protein
MLGPVRSINGGAPAASPRQVSLGTNDPPEAMVAPEWRHGWRKPLAYSHWDGSEALVVPPAAAEQAGKPRGLKAGGVNVGRHMGESEVRLAPARLLTASNWAMTLMAAVQAAWSLEAGAGLT